MSYATKNRAKVSGSILAVIVLAAIAAWQFYLFASFEDGGVAGVNGNVHLWWAIAMAVFSCIAAVLVFSVFLQHDTDDDLHITSSPYTSTHREVK